MDLSEIGLTQNEAKAYETLLKLGKTTAAHVCKESRIPYGRIYDVLASLEEKGLAKTIPEKTRKYVPSDPKSLNEYIQKKKQVLDKTEQQIKQFKAIYESHEHENVQIVKGERNFKRIIKSMISSKKYNYNVKYDFKTDPEFIRILNERKKKNVEMKTLGRYDEETKKNFEKWKKLQGTVKPIENEGVVMSIHDGKELLFVMRQSNTIMLIKDKPFIRFMEKLFNCYYEHN